MRLGCLLFGLMLMAVARAATPAAEGFIVHFAPGGRFAASTPVVSHWLREDVAVVRRSARRMAGGQATLAAEMEAWRRLPGVRLVEPDAVGEFAELGQAPAPNDPLYAQQDWLAVVDARRLWAVGDGHGVTVAVIDSGVDLTHPDLQANLLPGYDCADDNDQPQDRIGHGTAVAGLLGAVANNAQGISGLAPGVKILPFKVSPESGSSANRPLSSAVAAAVDRATASGVDIINLSLTITETTEVVRQAIQRALEQGIWVVAAAGNNGVEVEFPATMPGVIAVANVNNDGSLASSSRYGPEIAIAAPGMAPRTTLRGGGYGTYGSGTSFSAPVVAATLAALKSANPHWTKATLLAALRATAKAVPEHDFGSLQAGQAAVRLTPDLGLTRAGAFAGGDNIELNYRLPASDTPVDVYVAVDTPLGSFSLQADGGWQAVEGAGYLPLARAYGGGAASGTLFGGAGIFAALPAGSYRWRVALLDSASQRLLGPVVATPMTVQP